MELWQIRYFLEVARAGSISAAAANLNTSQPPLSRQIRAIEDEVGVPLFIRKNYGLELTQAGRVFEEKGKELMLHYDEFISEVHLASQKEKNRIVFGCNDGGEMMVLPLCTALFERKFAYAEVISYTQSTEEILDGVTKGDLDIGFVRLPFTEMENYDIIEFNKETWVALTAPDYAGTQNWGAKVTIEELLQLPLIMPSRRSLYLPLVEALSTEDKKPMVLSYYFELLNGVSLALHGLGVSIVPSSIVKISPDENYKLWAIEGLELDTCYGAIKKKGRYTTQPQKKFWKILNDFTKKIKSI